MARPYNFCGGPATLPESVLKQASQGLFDYQGRGYSVLEMSHRSGVYDEIYQETKAGLRSLMAVPDDYDILFLQGGATLQFSMVPLNLMKPENGSADFVTTGVWAEKAAAEARRFGTVREIASSKDQNHTAFPNLETLAVNPNADYLHITTNNTIYGTRMHSALPTTAIPIVADASSHILAEPLDVSRYGVIYAGAQKNIGIAGMAVVMIKQELIGKARKETPVLLDYGIHAAKKSAYNTPPVFAVYMAGLVFKWAQALGGVSALHELNLAKAKLLYDFLDGSSLFFPLVQGPSRSLTNVTFRMHREDRADAFHEEATARGLLNLKGHRSVGGMRVSLYNAMPLEGVQALVAFLKEFEAKI